MNSNLSHFGLYSMQLCSTGYSVNCYLVGYTTPSGQKNLFDGITWPRNWANLNYQLGEMICFLLSLKIRSKYKHLEAAMFTITLTKKNINRKGWPDRIWNTLNWELHGFFGYTPTQGSRINVYVYTLKNICVCFIHTHEVTFHNF